MTIRDGACREIVTDSAAANMRRRTMRMWFGAVACSAIIGLSTVASPVFAQQKTVKACQAEWRANKADNQAKGITEKAYVAQCRGGGASAQPTSAPAPTPAPTASTPARKTAKTCQAEWRANKEGYQAGGVTEKAYVDKCRAGETVAVPTTTPAPAPTASTPAPTRTSAPPATPTRTTVTTPTGANEFSTEDQARARCPSDTVVWADLKSKIFHFSGYKNYGNTKEGAYMCERDATGQGFRASKTEKHPGA